ncbi:MAG TPA: FAD/NAD(P)-binding oxidoreductase, partial [Gemmatimonadaceae bacterium]|nr:FAD/NAD(P)-binding oxidoreductase [Gemmatimonadaceae bacterium]
PRHVYQPGLLFVPFGGYRPDEIVRPRRRALPPGAALVERTVERIQPSSQQVILGDGTILPYDILVIASGSHLLHDETEGLRGEGWMSKVFDFYTLEGASALARKFATWEGGRLVVNVIDMPIKCPVAPLEFAFLADAYFTKRGIRDRVQLTYVTPLDNAFTKPVAANALAHLLKDKGIELVTEFATGQVDGANGRLVSWDEREVPFDILVTTPLHGGAQFVRETPGLGDDLGWVKTNPRTLQSQLAPNIFAIGDATNVPASKAGSVVHFEAEVLDHNIARFVAGEPLAEDFDGHSNCFIETGFDKALLIDFNYEVEPLPGKFPSALGPLTLLRESRLNHLGKLAFRWVYWNVLLPGREIPGIAPQMPIAGKRRDLLPPSILKPASRAPTHGGSAR